MASFESSESSREVDGMPLLGWMWQLESCRATTRCVNFEPQTRVLNLYSTVVPCRAQDN